jgi:hypothetical protein
MAQSRNKDKPHHDVDYKKNDENVFFDEVYVYEISDKSEKQSRKDSVEKLVSYQEIGR